MRSQVMKLAHALRTTGLSFSDAIKRAWKAIRIKVLMEIQKVSFSFKKEDGTIREATGCYLAAPSRAFDSKPCPTLQIRYFDLTCSDWRSFRADRLIIA